MLGANTVLFAIQAGVQLAGAVRRAYVDATQGRALVLPLPASAALDATSAFNFFSEADDAMRARHPRGCELGTRDLLSADEEVEIVALYREALAARKAEDDGAIRSDELNALFTVRQWKDETDPTLLQAVGGTLVNIAIDYFLTQPGALSDKRPEGRALRSFLEVLDTKDFATVELKTIAPDLMVAVVDSVAANPDLFGGGANEQALLKGITGSLAASAKEKLQGKSADDLRTGSAWLQLAARAVVKGGAETILANPSRFLGVKANVAPLIDTVGKSVAGLVIGEHSVTLRPLLTQQGLDTIAKASLRAVAANPGFLGVKNKGLENVIVEVAKSVGGMRGALSKDIFPEVVRLVLDKSANNLDLLWPTTDAKKHLLVAATKSMLKQIAKAPATGQKWKPRFTGNQLVVALEAVLDEVVDNPDWLVKRAGKTDPILGEAVGAILIALRQVDGKRLSAATGIAVLRVGIGAVAMQIRFLDTLPGEARTAIQAALDALFGVVFADGADAAANWKLAKGSAVMVLVKVSLEELAKSGLEPADIETLKTFVTEELASPAPFNAAAFAVELRDRLTP